MTSFQQACRANLQSNNGLLSLSSKNRFMSGVGAAVALCESQSTATATPSPRDEEYATCCDVHFSRCEDAPIPLAICEERLAPGDPDCELCVEDPPLHPWRPAPVLSSTSVSGPHMLRHLYSNDILSGVVSSVSSPSSACDSCRGIVKEKVIHYEQVAKNSCYSSNTGRPSFGENNNSLGNSASSNSSSSSSPHVKSSFCSKDIPSTLRFLRLPGTPAKVTSRK